MQQAVPGLLSVVGNCFTSQSWIFRAPEATASSLARALSRRFIMEGQKWLTLALVQQRQHVHVSMGMQARRQLPLLAVRPLLGCDGRVVVPGCMGSDTASSLDEVDKEDMAAKCKQWSSIYMPRMGRMPFEYHLRCMTTTGVQDTCDRCRGLVSPTKLGFSSEVMSKACMRQTHLSFNGTQCTHAGSGCSEASMLCMQASPRASSSKF